MFDGGGSKSNRKIYLIVWTKTRCVMSIVPFIKII